MPLKLRPTGLGSGIDKDRPDYTVYSGQWDVGRIYQTRGGPDNLRWRRTLRPFNKKNIGFGNLAIRVNRRHGIAVNFSALLR
jgi:hypothetical protein